LRFFSAPPALLSGLCSPRHERAEALSTYIYSRG
jgi:hypothetical protein